MKIQRKRYAVMRNNRVEILADFARTYIFWELDKIGNATIKTFSSKEQAYTICHTNEFEIEVVPVMETIEILED